MSGLANKLYKFDPVMKGHMLGYRMASKVMPFKNQREAFANNLFGGSIAQKMGYQRFDKGAYAPKNAANPWYGWGTAAAAATDKMRKPRITSPANTLLDDETLGG